jgi:hypothetical protein
MDGFSKTRIGFSLGAGLISNFITDWKKRTLAFATITTTLNCKMK